MLEGWYCRSIANNNAGATNEVENAPAPEAPNYKEQYRNLKRKLKFLIYENECFQEALRSTQRKLLKVNRDKSFLLDRLLQYEKVDASFSESDASTESSEDEASNADASKRKKVEVNVNVNVNVNNHTPQAPTTIIKPASTTKRRKPTPRAPKAQLHPPISVIASNNAVSMMSDGHMTPEEVERHLESRQTYLELVPEKAPPTVPTEMFSNDPSLDSEPNGIGDLEISNNIGQGCLNMMVE